MVWWQKSQVKRAGPSPLSQSIRFSLSLHSCATSFSTVLLLKCSQSSFFVKFGSLTRRSTYLRAPFISGGRILAVEKLYGPLNIDVSTSSVRVRFPHDVFRNKTVVCINQQRAASREVHTSSHRYHMDSHGWRLPRHFRY